MLLVSSNKKTKIDSYFYFKNLINSIHKKYPY